MMLCEWISWSFFSDILRDILVNVVSGLIAFFTGYFFYKKLKKKQTFAEVEIQHEISIQYIVNEFMRMREKYSKPFTEKTFSPQVELEISYLYEKCCDVRSSCKNYNLPFDSDVLRLMKYMYAQKGILYCNNQLQNMPPVEDEKFAYFEKINLMKAEGIGFNPNSNRSVYFELLQYSEKEIEELIKTKTFFKKYWKY